MRKYFYILLAVVVMSTGCVKQELPEGWDGRGCPVSFGLQLEYKIDIDGENVAPEEMGDIRIFVFDSETGILYDIIELTDDQITTGRIPADLPPGKYDFVAWGFSDDDMAAGGFDDNAVVGRTTLDDFRVTLKTEGPNAEGYYTPQDADFGNLFYASNQGYEVTGSEDQTVSLTFVRNSHMLLVRVSGVQYIPTPETRADEGGVLRIYVTGRDGSFMYDDAIDPASRVLYYEPEAHHLPKMDSVYSDVKVLRLDKNYHTGTNKMELVVGEGEKDFELRIDVLEWISRMTDPDSGELLYPTQADISREKEFLIHLEFKPDTVNGGVVVTVNDWVIGYYRPSEIIPWIPVED